jgi:hypothetical protein
MRVSSCSWSSVRHCHGNRKPAAYPMGCRHGPALLPPPSLPARAEIPLVALLRLMHLGIACLVGIFGRRRRIDDCCIDDRASGHFQSLRRQMPLHFVERVLGGVALHLMVTDPPYGVNYDPAWRNQAGRRAGARRDDGVPLPSSARSARSGPAAVRPSVATVLSPQRRRCPPSGFAVNSAPHSGQQHSTRWSFGGSTCLEHSLRRSRWG